MSGVSMLAASGRYVSSGIYVENWAGGQKVTATASAVRWAAATNASAAAVLVDNRTSATVWVRTDDGVAADDGQSRVLGAGDRDVFAVTSGDGKISLLGTAGNTGSVYLMPAAGNR